METGERGDGLEIVDMVSDNFLPFYLLGNNYIDERKEEKPSELIKLTKLMA